MGRIVVGVDGSEGSAAALRWAIDEARRRQSEVDVVHAWEIPYVGEASFSIGPQEFEAEAQAVLDQSIRDVEPIPSDVVLRPMLLHGPAAGQLIDTAEGAELLVLSSRGHGGFVGLLLGSVSQQCLHHSTCAVVVVTHRG